MAPRKKPLRDLSQSNLYDANGIIPAVSHPGGASKALGAPRLRGLNNKRMRKLFRLVNAGVPIDDVHIVMKEEPSPSNPDGFTIG